jgi:hypothetical protein
MKPLSCAATRRRLQAFHDGELDVRTQIAVGSHLEWCDHCGAALAELDEVRNVLQACVVGRPVLTHEEAAVFNANVVNRLKAEDDAALFTRMRGMFDDMHFVYAGLGAAAAALLCVVIVLGMMRFAADERPDSLAAIVNVLATPLECDSVTDLGETLACRERWAERFQRANASAGQDAVFTLEALLTRQARLPNLPMLRTGRQAATSQVELIEGLLDVVSRSRLDAAQPMLPATAQVLLLVERATVRANKPALDVPLPPKKRAEAIARIRTVRA